MAAVTLVACGGATSGASLPSTRVTPPTLRPSATTPRTLQMYVTSYGYDDNSPPSTQIAYPVVHRQATEGTGSYDDPSTFATDSAELRPGSRIYVPHLRKYYVMEDDCTECDDDWRQGHRYHVDLWQGPQQPSPEDPLSDCEAEVTRDSAPVMVDPPTTLTVDPTPLFSNGRCTAHVY